MNRSFLRRRHLVGAAAPGTLQSLPFAQTGRMIRIVVPFTPGGSTEVLVRSLAPKLGSALDANVIVDNKPGSLGALEAAKAAPDGNTLLMGHISAPGRSRESRPRHGGSR